MIKSKAKRSYDVKSFLSKNKTKRSFVAFTLTGASIRLMVAVILFMLIVPIAFSALRGTGFFDTLVRTGVSYAHPFFKSEKKTFSGTKVILLNLVSPLFEEKQIVMEKKLELPKISIVEKNVYSNSLDIKNETEYNIDVPAMLNESFAISTNKPKVLIVHTHGSESYTQSKKYSYTPNGNYRTQDLNYNVVRVGEELAKNLEKNGIDVIHDKTINDYPSYNDSYNKTAKIIQKHIEKDPDIAFVFDIHRDAVGEGDNVVKFVSEVRGENTAQVMIVCGTDTNLENPDWMENLKLALKIQSKFETDYPGFLRPLNLRKERFNMHLTTGSLLFEVGTNGNTLDEALASARFLAEGLSDIINKISQ